MHAHGDDEPAARRKSPGTGDDAVALPHHAHGRAAAAQRQRP
jgi:hypothetical protein